MCSYIWGRLLKYHFWSPLAIILFNNIRDTFIEHLDALFHLSLAAAQRSVTEVLFSPCRRAGVTDPTGPRERARIRSSGATAVFFLARHTYVRFSNSWCCRSLYTSGACLERLHLRDVRQSLSTGKVGGVSAEISEDHHLTSPWGA